MSSLNGSRPPAGGPSGRFPPIAEYGMLGDCEANALVAPSGSIEWMCLPRPDSPSVFGAILDRAAGFFRVGPKGASVPAGRRYLPGTMVLETTWQTATGWLTVLDALLVGPWRHRAERSAKHRRTPQDQQAECVLVRLMECAHGTVEVDLDCLPSFDYARRPARWAYADSGYSVAEAATEGMPADEDVRIRLTTDLLLGLEGPRAHARTTLRQGQLAFAALSWGDGEPPDSAGEAAARIQQTVQFWREWLGRGRFPDHPWRVYLQRSALVLKSLTYAPSGGLMAAPTTSLPETLGGVRNWDYRYSWLRDSTLMLLGLRRLGFDMEASDYLYFMVDLIEANGDLQVMYGIGGEKRLDEHELDHLSGYEGSRPVRIGNGAWNQVQHDVWGVALDSIWVHVRETDGISERAWRVTKGLVEAARENWRRADRGIWEVRGEPQHFVGSKVLCWVALDRGARLADLRGHPDVAARWREEAEEIKEEVLRRGVDDRGVFVQHYETNALDASALLIPLVHFLPPNDPRVRATVHAVANELAVDELVLRYRVDETDDGLEGEEGSFVICSFWLVSALVVIGEVEKARSLLEKLLSFASPLGLYAEEIDAHSGRHLGNFPQAFSHLALIDAVVRVIDAERNAGKASAPLARASV